MERPCLYCTKVCNVEACTNKQCKEWIEWFIERWETTRSLYSVWKGENK